MEYLEKIKLQFGIVGHDPTLQKALEKAIKIAPTDVSVMVIGESGVGKEFIPKIIHSLSYRKHYPYIAINCGAIPEGTIDSELFGHEKGSFTGASHERKGYFETAHKGTLFLDELGELPLSSQVRLLRVLQSGEFIKVGSSNIQKTDVRIITATNANILEAIERGAFRKDLYYRLNIVKIYIPSLRERKEDIALLFTKFSSEFADKYQKKPIRLTPAALLEVESYPWPGNIRQLRHFVEGLSLMNEGEISLEKIKEQLKEINQEVAIIPLPPIVKEQKYNLELPHEKEFFYKMLFETKKDLIEVKNDIKNIKEIIIDTIDQSKKNDIEDHSNPYISHLREPLYKLEDKTKEKQQDLKEIAFYKESPIYKKNDTLAPVESLSLQEKEKEFIVKALEKNKGKRKSAAKELGISERTLYRKINEYGIYTTEKDQK